jgi:hypothetical protein
MTQVAASPAASDEERLERGELLFFPHCPFSLPAGEDLAFLRTQRLGRFAHKNISYDPVSGRVGGHLRQGPAQTERLRRLLADFSRTVAAWVRQTFARYRPGCVADRATFRSEEEATRRLRLTARNDLLHIDAFPSRPALGRRILRVFVNVNPTEPRVWLTSDPFARLFVRYREFMTLPGRGAGWLEQAGEKVLRLFRPGRPRRSPYDTFMLRFHNFLKRTDVVQEKGSKRLWSFPPGSAWVAMTDACSHAVLRGRYALEHSFFVGQEVLALPDESPAALLAGVCGRPVHLAA